MNEPIISVKNLTKSYRLYVNSSDRLKESLWPWKLRHSVFNALNNVSFDVQKGEHLAIIGMNGAGKSTLLQILTGVLAPTSGKVTVSGRVAALLELGAGFNQELTGRENVAFQMQLADVSSSIMPAKLKEVELFADIGGFFDQPVKTYSSGMFVRVAFASAIFTKPDILIVDEALAVGDAKFQKKCLDYMEKLRESGTTFIIVTHDIYSAKIFANRFLLLHQGCVYSSGSPDKVATEYSNLLYPLEETLLENNINATDSQGSHVSFVSNEYVYTVRPDINIRSWGSGGAQLSAMRVYGLFPPNRLRCSNKIVIECDYILDNDFLIALAKKHMLQKNLLLGVRLDNSQGLPMTDFASAIHDNGMLNISLENDQHCSYRFSAELPELAPGNYFLTPGMALGVLQNLVPIFSYDNLAMISVESTNKVLGLFRTPLHIERIL